MTYPKLLIEIGLPSERAPTLKWQPIVKVEHYRLRQDSVKHPVELKEDSPLYRTNKG